MQAFKNANTIKTYRSHLKMLTEFQEANFKNPIHFDDVTLDFYHDLKKFMVEVKQYNDNT